MIYWSEAGVASDSHPGMAESGWARWIDAHALISAKRMEPL